MVIRFLTFGFHFWGSHSHFSFHVRFLSMYLPILTRTLETPESHQTGYQNGFSLLMAFLLAFLQSF